MRTPEPPFRLRPVNDDAAAAPGGMASWLVQAPGDVAMTRRQVQTAAAAAGLDADRAAQFTFAVNEVVINAVRHAGGTATVDVATNGGITVTVTDTGPGFRVGGPPDLPPVDQLSGRGLWLIHRLCDDVVIDSSERGTVVRLRAHADA